MFTVRYSVVLQPQFLHIMVLFFGISAVCEIIMFQWLSTSLHGWG